MKKLKMFALAMLTMLIPAACAQPDAPPKHFYNAPENINPDPNYVPGDYALQDIYAARTGYYAKKAELAAAAGTGDAVTLGTGEISFTIAKNETAHVTGTLKEFLGTLKFGAGGPEKMEIILDVNSLETGVPGRNNRILDIFFQSMKPEWGTASAVFDHFDLGGAFDAWKDGESREVRASGTLTLNGTARPVTATLTVRRRGQAWLVESSEPLTILLTDFGFENRIYDLMKACNHKSIGNAVEIKVKLELR